MPATGPQQNSYDVIVVGGGIGGVTAGAMLANAGLGVLVVEAADRPGGLVRPFMSGGLQWDPAVHLMLDPPHWGRLFDSLGVADQVEFTIPPVLWRVVVDDLDLATPFGREPCIEAHVEMFPRSADGVRRFLTLCADMHEALHRMMAGGAGMAALQELLDDFPDVMKLRTATLAQAMDEHVDDPEARALLALPGLYLGLPPSRLSFSVFAQHVFAHAVDGAGQVNGGSQRLVEVLAEAVEKHGGEIVTGRRVTGIGIKDGRASSVELDGEQRISAGAVVSNADPLRTFGELLGDPELPIGYTRKLRRLTPSHSTFNSFFATQAPLEQAAHSGYTVYYSIDKDAEAAWHASFAGQPSFAYLATPTLLSGRAAGQPHQVITTSSAPYDAGRPWDEAQAEYAESAAVVLDRAFPGARGELVMSEFASPVTTERYTLNHRGAQYGWGNGPESVGSRALDQVTPIEDLYLAGSWTSPGSGFLRASIAGRLAAVHIARRAGVPLEVPW